MILFLVTPLFSFNVLKRVCFLFLHAYIFYSTRNSQKELIPCHVTIITVGMLKTFFMEGNNVFHGIIRDLSLVGQTYVGTLSPGTRAESQMGPSGTGK